MLQNKFNELKNAENCTFFLFLCTKKGENMKNVAILLPGRVRTRRISSDISLKVKLLRWQLFCLTTGTLVCMPG